MGLVVELLDTSVHTREKFSNPDVSIESFLKKRANKEHKQNISDTYVIVDNLRTSEIFGYFTLSNSSILIQNLPESLVKKLPSYPSVGTVLLGRIGRDYNLTPRGFGAIILKEAMRKSLERGSFFALELKAKNESLVRYYERFDFIRINSAGYDMIIPYLIIKKSVGS